MTYPIYSPDQVKVLYPIIDNIRDKLKLRTFPRYFVLGGPANGDEAQRIVTRYPWCRVVGVEPIKELVEYQRSNGFPGTLLHGGLDDTEGERTIYKIAGNEKCSSMLWNTTETPERVPTVTLDKLSEREGPFTRGVLWIDIEGMEMAALKGATGVLKDGGFGLINLEVNYLREENGAREIAELLKSYSYEQVHEWDHHRSVGYCNRVYSHSKYLC